MTANFSMNSFVAGVMLGALLAAAWFFNGNTIFTSSFPATQPNAESQLPESGAISIADQSAGTEVVVESITVAPPGVWVAVREVSGKDFGNVLGAARVQGPRSVIAVQLLRPTVPGLSYVVQLYRDDGDNVFDLATDSAYIDFATGKPVIARFVTTN